MSFDRSQIYNVKLKVYLDGALVALPEASMEVYSFENPLTSYVTDFEENPVDDFLGDNFSIDKPAGFGNNAIHSRHDYKNSVDQTFTLVKPIIISETNSKMTWLEVAIIQPGDSGSVSGEPGFKDYVIIEGSKTPNEWVALLDGYDARLYPDWEEAWSIRASYHKLYKTHTINLADSFSPSDTVLIRFRLYSDETETGWGWTIDSLQIQDFPLAIENNKIYVRSFSLQQNYPNPFNPVTTITYNLPKASDVSLKIYNSAGQEIRTLVSGFQSPGSNTITWDGKNSRGQQLPSGVYLYKIKARDYSETRKAVLVK